VTESFNEMESIDFERVLIRGIWVEGRGMTVSRFETEAAGRCRLGEDRLLGLPSIVSNGFLLLKRTLGPESLEEEERVDEVESLRAWLTGPFDLNRISLLNFNTLPGSPPSSFKASPSFRPLDRGGVPRPNVSKLDLSPAPPTPASVLVLGPKSVFDKSTKGTSGSYSAGWNDQVDLPVSGSEGNEEVVDHLMKDLVLSPGLVFTSEIEVEVEVGVGMVGCRNEVGGA
jgi:hypothetical protein